MRYTLPLTGHTIIDNDAKTLTILGARFIIWCRKNLNLTDREATCLITAGLKKGSQNGIPEKEINETASRVMHKLPSNKIIDITEDD